MQGILGSREDGIGLLHRSKSSYSSISRFDDVRAILSESAPSLAFPTWRATTLATSASTRKPVSVGFSVMEYVLWE